ncbi:MAG: ATP-binding protein [Betaproteobacteria bacterium]
MSALGSRLYLRIWLAVVAAVVLLTLAAAWAWRASREASAPEPPTREIVLRNQAGEVIASAQAAPERRPGQPLLYELNTPDGQRWQLEMSRPPRPPGPPGPPGPGDPPHGGPAYDRPPHAGPPYDRPPRDHPPHDRPPHDRPPHPGPPERGLLDFWPLRGSLGFFWLLPVVALAVALGAYPVIRRLTKRLEALQTGVERWGQGDLSARMQVEGSDEVAFLAERFNQAAERIEQLLASHKALLANASHELRSPLARIRMSLELLGQDGPQAAAQRDEIGRSIRELDQLIDEILLASRLDRQGDAEPFEEVDLMGLAAEECARTGAQLHIEPGDVGQGMLLQGSPRLLRRLLRNLLENAQRHGAGEVAASIERQGPQWVLSVRDHGPGVPPSERQRIFEPFYRLPGRSEQAGGVGLGLALVRTIAQRHGGDVTCEEALGGGAMFVVRLPRLT